jgi:hypothetical protein
LYVFVFVTCIQMSGRDGAVGIATRYGLDDSGLERGLRHTHPGRPGALPNSRIMVTGFTFLLVYSATSTPSGAEVKHGVEMYLHSPAVPVLACYGVTFTFLFRHNYGPTHIHIHTDCGNSITYQCINLPLYLVVILLCASTGLTSAYVCVPSQCALHANSLYIFCAICTNHITYLLGSCCVHLKGPMCTYQSCRIF